MSSDDTIKLILDLDNPPPLTAKQQEMLDRLAAMPDEEIDFSDIPECTDFPLPPPKEDARLRLDGDVLAWLAESRHGADWKANSILRHEMLRARGWAEVDRRRAAEAGRAAPEPAAVPEPAEA